MVWGLKKVLSMAQLTCFGGVGQIGGNQFLLEDGGARFLFDFGTPFSERGRFYEEYLNPRAAFGLLDPLAMGLLPQLRGIYRPDLEQGLPGLWDAFQGSLSYRDLRDAPVNGVLLSHAHMDHSGYISFLNEETPIFTSALTAFVTKAIQDSSPSDFETQVVYAVPRELRADGLLASGSSSKVPAVQRPFRVFEYDSLSPEAHSFWEETPAARALVPSPLGAATEIGGLEVRCYPVDHSIPGACAFAVKTSVGWVAYTGDIRFHGSLGALSRQFIQELSSLKPVALLCEGTRADLERDREPIYTEQEVRERALEEVRQAKGLVLADFGPRNVERLLIFAGIAREVGRALVVLPKDAYLLKAANLADPSIPSIRDIPDLLVYDEPKLSTDRWEKAIRQECQSSLVSPSQVQRRQDQYILCFSFYDLNKLPTIKPKPGSLYIYSSHEAFNEELQLDFRRLRSWIEHFGMRWVGLPLEELDWGVPTEQQGLHASGHADGRSLAKLIREVSPAILIPIHTEERGIEYFRQRCLGPGMRMEVPRYGTTIDLDSLL